MEYKIVGGANESVAIAKAECEAEVTLALSEGWVCTGGVSANVFGNFPQKPYSYAFFQALIKA